MSEKITIIEGPTPTFQDVNGLWSHSLIESHLQHDTIFTELRATNGTSLVNRCRQAWLDQEPIYLEYRTEEGLPDELPIVAAHSKKSEEGDVLQLWLRLERGDVEIEIEYIDDDFDDGFDDYFDDDELDDMLD